MRTHDHAPDLDPARADAAARDVPAGKRTLTADLAVERPVLASGLIQRKAARDDNGVAADAGAHVDRAASSSGAPLPEELRARFESSLGADLSGVRVHTGAASATAAHAVGARAYTVGQDIHFGAGHFDPGSASGQHLLAHEVAHTVQQASSGTAGAQFKLEVSTPADAAELEADRAADAMVAGAPAAVTTSSDGLGVSLRSVFRYAEPAGSDTGSLQGAGDEAEANAATAPLSIDSASVTADKGRAQELITEIDANQPTVLEAERQDSRWQGYKPAVTNTTTKTNLQIFGDKLETTSVDTAAFAVQYRASYADYQRLVAEAAQYLGSIGGETSDPVGSLTEGFGAMKDNSLGMGESQAGLERFRSARRNLNTAAEKMDGKIKGFRGAAQALQGAVYGVRAKAAAAQGKDAAKKLAAVRAEIEAFAQGVGMCVKMVTAVAGLTGGSGVTESMLKGNSSAKMKSEFDPSALTPVRDPSGTAMAKAIYGDLDKLSGDQLGKTAIPGASGMTVGDVASGDPAKIAQGLAKILGEQINKERIQKLQQTIEAAAAEEKSFNAAAEASSFLGHQTKMEAAVSELSTLTQAFEQAKTELAAARDALIAELNKKGGKGKDQAKAVMFLADSDRFLAQVKNAITVGEHQQENAKDAAKSRKELRGTTSTLENEKDRMTQRYWRAKKTTTPGKLWGTNDRFHLTAVDVTLQGGSGYNETVQGGRGSVEGTGGAADEVARKLQTLKTAETEVKQLQARVQSVLGVGAAGLNA